GARADGILQRIEKSMTRPIANLGGLTTLRDLAYLFRRAALLITTDSGPMHLANLYRKQTIVLWGPGNYERIRPLGENNTVLIKEIECRPCRQYKDPERCEQGENICLQSISVEDVLAVLEKKRKVVGL
ncbi:MAG: glycosyltransferase family 9 protein, partial [Chlorobiales bacterium]|nr:glycosyltransferase family 9 protein [Chlorobiales bacterium]